MLLVVDIGNTNVVVGVYDAKKLIACWRLSSRIARTSDEYWILLNSLFETSGISIKTSRVRFYHQWYQI